MSFEAGTHEGCLILWSMNETVVWKSFAVQSFLISHRTLRYLKFPSPCPLVLLIRSVSRWRWYGALVEWYGREKAEMLGPKRVPEPFCPSEISYCLSQDRSLVSVVRGLGTRDWATKIKFLPQREHTTFHYKDQSVNNVLGNNSSLSWES